jgi:hypothetical protein
MLAAQPLCVGQYNGAGCAVGHLETRYVLHTYQDHLIVIIICTPWSRRNRHGLSVWMRERHWDAAWVERHGK